MSLNYDLTNVEDFEGITSENEWVVTSVIIHECMWLGMQKITEDNALEFYTRQTMWDKCFGGILIENDEIRSPTFDEIKRRIGLSVNVTQLTRAAWKKDFIKAWEEHVEYGIRRELEAIDA